jgi:exosortase K
MLVGLLTGNEFAYEAAGFVNTRLGLVITPACAGVNFLVMALLTLVFGSAGYSFGPGRKLLLCAGFVLSALGATVIVNATRIVLIAYVFSEHRLLGVVLYASALSLLHLGSRALLGQALSKQTPLRPVACAC